MTPETVICYCTDKSYLFPTLVSAIQARRNISTDIADVLIVCFDVDQDVLSRATSVCSRENIRLIARSERDIDHAPAMLGRLYLDEILPPEYRFVLYADGDTQIKTSLEPLLKNPPPIGRFYAAADPMVFLLEDENQDGENVRNHFKRIGIDQSRAKRYFNSGVIFYERTAWSTIAKDARNLFRSQTAMSKFPDQDILNFIGIEQSIPFSLTWNFPVFLLNYKIQQVIPPGIIHYMSQPKPWDGNFPPWSASDYAPYPAFIKKYPELSGLWKKMPLMQSLRYAAQQRYKRVLEAPKWGSDTLREQILRYEATTLLPVSAPEAAE